MTSSVMEAQAMSNTAVSVVEIVGSLDINNVEEFEQVLSKLFKEHRFKIVLNLEKLTYISSAGIGVLMSIIKDVRKNRGDIKITNVVPDVYKVFDLLELPGIFHFLKSEQDAINSF
jgi:anti-anti-sigma factor